MVMPLFEVRRTEVFGRMRIEIKLFHQDQHIFVVVPVFDIVVIPEDGDSDLAMIESHILVGHRIDQVEFILFQ